MNRSLPASTFRACALVLSCCLLSACFGGAKPQATQYYLLRTESSTFANDSSAAKVTPRQLAPIHLASVQVAPYLNQSGLIMETDNQRIVAARYHQWSEPLNNSIPRFLSRSISDLYGAEITGPALSVSNAHTTIDIHIEQLHGQENGDVILEASWSLRPSVLPSGRSTTPQVFAFNDTLPLAEDGYDALVAAEKQLLTNLASAIAQSLPAQ